MWSEWDQALSTILIRLLPTPAVRSTEWAPTECLRGMLLGDRSICLIPDPSPYLKLGEENKYLLFS